MPVPLSISGSAEILDLNGQAIVAQCQFFLHPCPYYIGKQCWYGAERVGMLIEKQEAEPNELFPIQFVVVDTGMSCVLYHTQD